MRLAQYLEGCCAALAVLAGAPALLGWLATRHRLGRGGHALGEAVGTTVNQGLTGAPGYTLWRERHAVVRYADQQGREHTVTIGSDLPAGTQVSLAYDPRHPGRAQEETTVEGLRFGLLSWAVAAGLVAVILLT